jgi:hypothetical protein
LNSPIWTLAAAESRQSSRMASWMDPFSRTVSP